jgi:hypothetical protein
MKEYRDLEVVGELAEGAPHEEREVDAVHPTLQINLRISHISFSFLFLGSIYRIEVNERMANRNWLHGLACIDYFMNNHKIILHEKIKIKSNQG